MGAHRAVVQIDVDRERAELAADALWQAGPSAVLEVDLDADRVRLTADVADLSKLDERWSPVLLEVDDDAYLDAWRTWARPIRAGRAVVLWPDWLDRRDHADVRPDDVVVALDPGRAFGSGSHETTRLAVAGVEAHVRPGDRVLDVGCGSGVLCVLAARLGAASAHGIDVDPEAVAATRANADRNGVAARVSADTERLADLGGTYDLVVANIGGSALFDLARDLEARTRPGGLLVLAGILDDRAGALRARFPRCAEVDRASESGWSLLVLRRPG